MKKGMCLVMGLLLLIGCSYKQDDSEHNKLVGIENNEIKINDMIYEIERYEEIFAQIKYELKDEENEIVITLPKGTVGWEWIAPYANQGARLSKMETVLLREYDGTVGESNYAQQYTYELLSDIYVSLSFKNAFYDEILKNMSFDDTKADFTLEIVLQ